MISLDTAEALIASSRPRGGLLRGTNLILLGASMLLGAYLAKPELFGGEGALGWLFPQILILALIGLVAWTSIQQRRLAGLMLQAFEAVQLREWPRAKVALHRLLQHAIKPANVRAESLLALAAVAEADHAYDVSQRIYESVLAENEADPLQLHTSRVALAAAMLRTGQTTDAVGLIERLERADLPDILRAQIELLSLYREVTMGQVEDGVARAEERHRLFRQHLSTRAGYGYALLAAAFDRAGRPDRAGDYWEQATLLVRPDELIDRFKELESIAEKYPAAEMSL